MWTKEFLGKPRKPRSTAAEVDGLMTARKSPGNNGKAPEVALLNRNASDGDMMFQEGPVNEPKLGFRAGRKVGKHRRLSKNGPPQGDDSSKLGAVGAGRNASPHFISRKDGRLG